MSFEITIKEFVQKIVENKNTLSEVIELVKLQPDNIRNLCINDIISYDGEMEIDVLDSTFGTGAWIANLVNNYRSHYIKRLDSTTANSKAATTVNLISYYIKFSKYKELEEQQLQNYLNSKTIEEHIDIFEDKIYNCKFAKELISCLEEANISPYSLYQHCTSRYYEINFLNLFNKKSITFGEKSLIKDKVIKILTTLDCNVTIEKYFNNIDKDIVIFNFQTLNLKIGAIGHEDSGDFTADKFIEVKSSEKVIKIWEPI